MRKHSPSGGSKFVCYRSEVWCPRQWTKRTGLPASRTCTASSDVLHVCPSAGTQWSRCTRWGWSHQCCRRNHFFYHLLTFYCVQFVLFFSFLKGQQKQNVSYHSTYQQVQVILVIKHNDKTTLSSLDWTEMTGSDVFLLKWKKYNKWLNNILISVGFILTNSLLDINTSPSAIINTCVLFILLLLRVCTVNPSAQSAWNRRNLTIKLKMSKHHCLLVAAMCNKRKCLITVNKQWAVYVNVPQA